MAAIVKIVLAVIGIIFLFSFLTFLMSIFPIRFKTADTPSNYGLEYEGISFNTSDDILIKGWFIPSKAKSNTTIIVTHGYPFDKNNVLGATHFLANNFNVLYFDFRYFGESKGKYSSAGFHEKKDLLSAIKYLKDRNLNKIGVLGFSLGAATALITNSDDVGAIVSDSSYSDLNRIIREMYRIFPSITKEPFVFLTKIFAKIFLGISPKDISPVNEISKTKAHILLIHGDKDSQISVKNSKLLFEASNKNRTELWIVEGVDHGQAHFLNKKKYEKKVIDLFEQI